MMNYEKMSNHDKEMVQLLFYIKDNVKAFRYYLAVRKVEIEVSEAMETFNGKENSVTLHDLTRFMMKNCPDMLENFDKAVKEVWKDKKQGG